MLEFRLKPRHAFPARPARLNRAHPLFNQLHFVAAFVAQGAGLRDLVTGVYGTNTTTLGGTDENGPYVYSADSAGTAAITIPGPVVGFQFGCWGCIFKLSLIGRQYVFAVVSGSGFLTNGANVSFNVNNGTVVNFVGIPGNTYFAFMNNAVGTAGLNRTCVLVDLTTGKTFMFTGASTIQLAFNPMLALVVNSAISNNRLYAAFACGSTLVPPAVNPAPTYYSIDQIMAGLSDPWALWYA
jgi:hypothetical protein